MRRLVCEYYDGFSFGDVREAIIRTCRGTVTDLLIGDLFTDKRGQGVGADGVALSAGQGADSVVGRRHAADDAAHKVNELMLPEGRRP